MESNPMRDRTKFGMTMAKAAEHGWQPENPTFDQWKSGQGRHNGFVQAGTSKASRISTLWIPGPPMIPDDDWLKL